VAVQKVIDLLLRKIRKIHGICRRYYLNAPRRSQRMFSRHIAGKFRM
jgi:hypothetical protein